MRSLISLRFWLRFGRTYHVMNIRKLPSFSKTSDGLRASDPSPKEEEGAGSQKKHLRTPGCHPDWKPALTAGHFEETRHRPEEETDDDAEPEYAERPTAAVALRVDREGKRQRH